MNIKLNALLVSIAVMMLLGFRAEAATWAGAPVSILELPDPGHNCIFFTLTNVSEADPAFPGNPWMAIPASQIGFQQMYELLLRVKLGGGAIGVVTSGAAAPGCTPLDSSRPIVGVTYLSVS